MEALFYFRLAERLEEELAQKRHSIIGEALGLLIFCGIPGLVLSLAGTLSYGSSPLAAFCKEARVVPEAIIRYFTEPKPPGHDHLVLPENLNN